MTSKDALKLQEENANLLTILDSDSRYIYVVDAMDSSILFANNASQKMWNKKEPYLGKVCYKYIKGEDSPCANCTLPFLKEGENTCHRPLHYDENLDMWLNITVCRILWQKKPAFMISVENITQEQKNVEHIKHDNALIESISKQYFEFIAVIDSQKRTIDFREIDLLKENAAPSFSNNYDEDALQAIETLVLPEDRPKFRKLCRLENITKQLETKSVYSYTWTQPLSEGRTARKQLTFWWLNKEDHKLICLKSDITDVYAQEQQQLLELAASKKIAEDANATKSRFLANMSHDMRTPLHSILGIASLAQEETQDPKAMGEYWSEISLAGEYLLALINDVLDMAKIEDNSLNLHAEKCVPHDFTQYIRTLFEEQCRAKGITLSIGLPEESPALLLDKLRMNQIFFNLISNAIKFTPQGGKVALSYKVLKEDEKTVTVENIIEDNGSGMSEEFQKKIFQPFEQDSNAYSPTQGTGLGLSITKKLVDLFKGTIKVESKLNVGTKITLRFTFKKAPFYQEKEYHHHIKVNLQGVHVLLAEDHPLNQLITKKILERQGIIVSCANDGKEALETFKASAEGSFDLILMDMRMPNLTGCQACMAIRALKRKDAPTIPIVALTANAYTEDVETTKAAGMNAHLSKPIVLEELFTTIQTLLHK